MALLEILVDPSLHRGVCVMWIFRESEEIFVKKHSAVDFSAIQIFRETNFGRDFKQFTLFLPQNIRFSPNGEGKNRILDLKGKNYCYIVY